MYELNLKNYDTDVRFNSVIDNKGLEYPEAPRGGVEITGVDGYIRSEYMVPPTGMVVPEIFMGFAPVVNEPSDPDFTQDEVVMEKNYAPAEPIVVEKTMKLNMRGKTITGPVFPSAYDNEGNVTETDSYGLWVKEGGNVLVEGQGVIEAQPATYSMAVWAQGGEVTIKDGKFYNAGDGCDLIYASKGRQVEIFGGEFHATERSGEASGTKNRFSALNVKDGDRAISKIVVYGGRFYGFDPANNVSEGPNTNFVAEGYESVAVEPNVWEVRPIVE
jgi:hypothetical protein